MKFDSKEQFNAIYKELYDKYFDKFEKMRKKKIENRKLRIIGFLLVCSIEFFCMAIFEITEWQRIEISNTIIFIICSLGIIGSPIIYQKLAFKKGENYVELYKKNVITEFMQKIFPNLEYLPEVTIVQADKIAEAYNNAKFEEREINRSLSDDYISGSFNDYKLNLCDFSSWYEYIDENKKTHYTNVFEGIFAKIKLNYEKDFQIKILHRSEKTNTYSGRVKLDNDEFNNNFVVITNSKIEAYRLLTADIIDILNEQRRLNDIEFDINIKEGNIYFRFFSDPIFEPSLNEQVMKEASFYRYYTLLNFIVEFSDIVNKIYKDFNV